MARYYDYNLNKGDGWLFAIAKLFGLNDISNNAMPNIRAKYKYFDFLDSLTETELLAQLEPYYQNTSNIFGNKVYDLDHERLLKELQQLQSINSKVPELPDFDSVYI